MQRRFIDFWSLHALVYVRSFARTPMLVGWLGSVISATVAILTLCMLAMSREQEIDRAIAASGNVAVALTREVTSNVERYNLDLITPSLLGTAVKQTRDSA
ncbi:hypothetical protein BURKHO8Y_20080 [Burkholderia sp. 8Y]|nr:hypothetical protein BURKHO8Y_20080 [Burkholderia sp. 8Y]